MTIEAREFKFGHSAAQDARDITTAFAKNVVTTGHSAGDTDLDNQPRGKPRLATDDDELRLTVEEILKD